jgi:hypothetical protein
MHFLLASFTSGVFRQIFGSSFKRLYIAFMLGQLVVSLNDSTRFDFFIFVIAVFFVCNADQFFSILLGFSSVIFKQNFLCFQPGKRLLVTS